MVRLWLSGMILSLTLSWASFDPNNVKLSEFWSQLQASYESNHTEELWYNETVRLWLTIHIYIYIFI